MSLNYSQFTRITVSSEHEIKIPKELIARIREYNQKDSEAIARGAEERAKRLLTQKKLRKKKTT
jgi:hypothetical protein